MLAWTGVVHAGWWQWASDIVPTDLRCEYLTDPIGIDVMKPRLSWKIDARSQNSESSSQNTRGMKQGTYQILVASSEDLLKKDKGDLWDSGKVESDQSVLVEYKGKMLESRMRCWWKVRVWVAKLETGNWKSEKVECSAWSRPGMWTMGLLEPASWAAKWIGPGTNSSRTDACYLRREFVLNRPIKSAAVSICGLGFFDCSINGQPVGDHVMDPAFTSYPKRAMYVTFDVTRHLRGGSNAVAVVLGPGRYVQHFPGRSCLLLQLDVVFEDGSTQQIVTDENWKVNANGPVGYSNEYNGEEYDARKEFGSWNSPGFDDSRWMAAVSCPAPCASLQAQMLEPMRVTQVIKPIALSSPSPGVYIVDMGQSFYGMTRLKVSGPAGTVVRMVGSYSLRPDGTLKTEDNRGARCTDVYTLKGSGTESWSPRFKGQGFRRVQVTGFPGTPTLDNFEGLVVHSDVQPAGEFACSSELINRIHQNIRWGQRMYKRSVPLDPDRDERQGWLGDPAKDAESDAYNFNVAPFYAKWLADIRMDQSAEGQLSSISPVSWPSYEGDLVWPSVFTIVPDWLHDFYGDRRVLEENYAGMKRWLDYQCRANQKPDFTVDRNAYGDWCDVSTIGVNGWGDKTKGSTSKPLIATAYHYNNIRIMARAARLLGKPEDCEHYESLSRKVGEAFNRRFLNPANASYESGTQCAYVLALMFDLVPPEHRVRVIQKLADDILVKNKGHLSVGLIGMQWLMQALDKIGRNDLAYTIVTQTDRPSWGYMISKGATSIWERWDTDTLGSGMNSEALLILSGNLDAWFYQALAGINYDRDKPGFKHIIIRPQPVGDLKWVNAHYESPYGRIISNWKLEEGNAKIGTGKLTMEVTIPANTTATVYVPAKDAAAVAESGKPVAKARGVRFLRVENGAAVYEVGSGFYEFESVRK